MGVLQTVSEYEGRLVLAGVITVGLVVLCYHGSITGEQLLMGLFGEGGLLAIIGGKKNGS